VSTKVQRRIEWPLNVLKPVDQALGDFGMQEIGATLSRGPIAVLPPGAAIKQRGRLAREGRH
jgi:hypothetical protein